MSKEIPNLNDIPLFERIKETDPQGLESWSARDLAMKFGYKDWDQFSKLIAKAREISNQANVDPLTQFRPSTKLTREQGLDNHVPDYQLTRYACWLIACHAGGNTDDISRARLYFDIHTYRQEQLENLNEDQQRVLLRSDVELGNKKLSKRAAESGLDRRYYWQFFDDGYFGLYGRGLSELRSRRGVPRTESILNYAHPLELSTNIARVRDAEQSLANELDHGRVVGTVEARETHERVGERIRRAMIEIGAIIPEEFPTLDHVKEAKKRMFAQMKADR